MATERQVVVIAGPNGAGKTTFALSFLRGTVAGLNFVNADLIAAGLARNRILTRVRNGATTCLQRMPDGGPTFGVAFYAGVSAVGRRLDGLRQFRR